ncbi:MAG: hypothetical protein KKB30_05365 [Proteobacteria bacterium]|nr:hypothetical protein [Pseudomonadota bacterium]MBU1716128.1 hypothetical protein [Pseudomonadota bacterium]
MNFFRAIVKNKVTGKHYMTEYRSGYKPSLQQMINPYEREKPHFFEVEWQRVVVEKWVIVDKDHHVE